MGAAGGAQEQGAGGSQAVAGSAEADQDDSTHPEAWAAPVLEKCGSFSDARHRGRCQERLGWAVDTGQELKTQGQLCLTEQIPAGAQMQPHTSPRLTVGGGPTKGPECKMMLVEAAPAARS